MIDLVEWEFSKFINLQAYLIEEYHKIINLKRFKNVVSGFQPLDFDHVRLYVHKNFSPKNFYRNSKTIPKRITLHDMIHLKIEAPPTNTNDIHDKFDSYLLYKIIHVVIFFLV